MVESEPKDVEPRRAHERALQLFGDRVRGVDENQWHEPTPCAEWDVRDLVEHSTRENYWAEQLLAGRTIEEVGDRFEGDLLGDDPIEDYDDSARRAREAANREGALNRTVHVSFGEIPGGFFIGQRWVDLVVHAWDLAVAIGQDPAVPEDLAAEAERLMLEQEEAVRASGVFGDPVEVDDDAPTVERLVAFLGRDPARWIA